ncbi:MAG: AraC family transcriptional regulator [Candidatus Pelagadaptatus aseana]|uniref:AraC family transcriptional regulator n=1 Tax=Candidatus Pelagadaptatus aseana TaxID=3120508 RepID=UPI0039B315BF
MASIDSLHIDSVLSFLQGCEQQGVAAETILAKIGVDPSVMTRPNARLPADRAGLLIETITRTLQDETLGFFDKPSPLGSIEMSLYASIGCHDLKQAIYRLAKYWRLFHQEISFEMETSGEEALLTMSFDRKDMYGQVSFLTWIVFFLTRWCNWIIDQPFIVDQLYLPFPATHEAEDFPHMFPSRFYFDQSKFQLVFNRHYLDKPLKRTFQDVPEFAALIPNLMSSHRVDTSLTGQIRKMLQNLDNIDALPLKVVADSMGKSPETIRRKLKAEGTSFTEIKESVRHDLAIYQLKNTDIAINQIAYNVGFSEPSAFNRAFKKWTGLTPGDYRNNI